MKSLKYCVNYQNVTHSHKVSKCCWKPTYDGSTYGIFPTLWWCESDMHSEETTSNFEFWSFPRLVICEGIILSSDTRQWQRATAPSQPQHHAGKQPTHYNHSVPEQPFCSSLSVQYSINYIRYSRFYYKIGFVLEDFAQL